MWAAKRATTPAEMDVVWAAAVESNIVSSVLAEWIPSGPLSKYDEATSVPVESMSSHIEEEANREIPENDAVCLPSAPCKRSRNHAELKGTVLQQILEEAADMVQNIAAEGGSWVEGERVRGHVPLWMSPGRWDEGGGPRKRLLRLRSRARTLSGGGRPHRSRAVSRSRRANRGDRRRISRARSRSRRMSRGDRRRHSRSRSMARSRTLGDRRRHGRARSMSRRRNRADRRRSSRRRSRARRMSSGDRRRHRQSRSRSRRTSRGDRRRTSSRGISRHVDDRRPTAAEMYTYLEYESPGIQNENVSLDHGLPIFARCLPECLPNAAPTTKDASLGPTKS